MNINSIDGSEKIKTTVRGLGGDKKVNEKLLILLLFIFESEKIYLKVGQLMKYLHL